MELVKRIENNCGKLIFDCTDEELYGGLLQTVKELQDEKPKKETKKKIYYTSAEFLIGKLLESNLIALGIYNEVREILEKNGKSLAKISETENEPSLGNGGLGRLAACFLDSAAHKGLWCDGVGLLYHFGLFRQKFLGNKQTEHKNEWMGNNLYLNKTDISYYVKFKNYTLRSRMYTIGVLGKGRDNKLNLFDLESVDESIVTNGVEYDKRNIEKNLTLFLYPDDSDWDGKRLRLFQEYFLSSCGAQLVIEESVRRGSNLYDLPEYAVIQINDTHSSLIICELILQLEKRGIPLDRAIEITAKICAYTNHTVLAEALETWDSAIIEEEIPQIMRVIRELDRRIKGEYQDKSLHIIDDNQMVHMARLDVHFGFSVNGVAQLHTDILKQNVMKSFNSIYPKKFNNKTNGISMRRWLISANPDLYDYIVSLIGRDFEGDYEKLRELEKFADNSEVLQNILRIKNDNKKKLSEAVYENCGENLDCNGIFDVQIKRMHEYKRQQMNALYLINKYLDIKNGNVPKIPITAIFGAKAAGAYTIAKDILHLILCMQELIVKDKEVSGYLRIYTVENYNVTWAEKIVPACDISEQISLASKEASGTGNMKMMLNGAVTLGTLDGANVEILSLVGRENIYIFGENSDTVTKRYRENNYCPREYYEKNSNIKRAVDFITGKELLSVGDRECLMRLQKELLNKDYFMTFPDFEDYTETKERAFVDFADREKWAKRMLINTARSGYFSSDRTIMEYNRDIWKL